MAEDKSRSKADFYDPWTRLGGQKTLGSMLLNASTDVADIEQHERREILELLPARKGGHILELGAGIGRFTRHFADTAERVVAVDFVASFVEQNRKANGGRGDVEFICADVRDLELPESGFDLVFSSWLLAYMEDREMPGLLDKIRRWLKPGAHLFVRESCKHSAIAGRIESPDDHRSIIEVTEYRHPDVYGAAFARRFEVAAHGTLETYMRYYGNPNQYYWLLRRP